MLDASPQTRVGRGQERGQGTPAPPPPPAPGPPDQHELHTLVGRRTELAAQIESLTERREEVADQLHGAEAAARPGLIARLGALDERIVRLEQEIVEADDAIAAAISAGVIAPPSPVEQTETTEQPWDMSTFSEEAVAVIAGQTIVFVLLAIILYQIGWRRAAAKFSRGRPEDSGRIDQLQNSVDAIAVEIERISEGQRYVSKVLNEGAAQDIVATGGQEEAIPVRRKAT
jgi:hypothetical protein